MEIMGLNSLNSNGKCLHGFYPAGNAYVYCIIEITELVKLFHYFWHSEDLSIPCDLKLILFLLILQCISTDFCQHFYEITLENSCLLIISFPPESRKNNESNNVKTYFKNIDICSCQSFNRKYWYCLKRSPYKSVGHFFNNTVAQDLLKATINHRIMEKFRLEGTPGGLVVQPSAQSWASFEVISGCLVSCPVAFWVSPGTEMPQLLWATWASVQPPSLENFFLAFDQGLKQDILFQMYLHKSWVERNNHFTQPAAFASANTGQYMLSLHSHKLTGLSQVQWGPDLQSCSSASRPSACTGTEG